MKNEIVLLESCLVEMETLVFRMKNIKGLDEMNPMDILGDASMALVRCIMEVNKNSLDTSLKYFESYWNEKILTIKKKLNDTLIKMGEKVKEEKLLTSRNGLRKPLGFAGNMRYQASGKYGNSKSIKCFVCEKEGHIAKNCPENFNKQSLRYTNIYNDGLKKYKLRNNFLLFEDLKNNFPELFNKLRKKIKHVFIKVKSVQLRR
ncbi:hypothetical protein COBT_002794 [Conglomerata obtusa]